MTLRMRGETVAGGMLLLAAVVLALPSMCSAGAPRHGDRFLNQSGQRQQSGFAMLPFLMGRVWTSLVPRSGAAPWVPYDRDAILHNPSVTWIGHASMLVRMDGVTFLTDPIFSERASPLSFAGPKRQQPPGIPLDALPPIDFVTLSHDHYDHTDLPSLKVLAKRGARFIVGLKMGDLVREAGGEPIELDWWQSTRIAGVEVHCVPAQHFSGRTGLHEDNRLWAGWVVAGPTRRFYHAGDTGYFDGFRLIGERLGPIDLAALPIGAYDPRPIMEYVHLNPEEAVRAAGDVRAQRVVAMHWGTFDLTDEPMDEPPQRFHAAAAEYGRPPENAWTLAVGETRRW